MVTYKIAGSTPTGGPSEGKSGTILDGNCSREVVQTNGESLAASCGGIGDALETPTSRRVLGPS